MCRRSSLKVLNHALQGREGVENCVKFIELYGLRTIFPFFMLPNKTCKKNAISGMEQDEHVISILVSLIRNVQGQQKERVLTKFLEKDMEKAERIVELHFFYKQRSSLSDSIISKEIQKSGDVPDEDEIYMKRLDGGLFVLQQIDLIILEVMYYGPVMLRERIHKLFEQQKVSIVTVKDVVVEFLQQLGDGSADGNSAEFSDKKKLLEMVNSL